MGYEELQTFPVWQFLLFFTIITYHKPLVSLKKSSMNAYPTGRSARWVLELDVYDYQVIHRDGKQQVKET